MKMDITEKKSGGRFLEFLENLPLQGLPNLIEKPSGLPRIAPWLPNND